MGAAKHTILVEQGASFSMRLRPTSSEITFVGSTTTGQIRRTYSATNPALADFTCTNGSDADGFYVDITLSAAETSAIPVTAASTHAKQKTKYVYDIETVTASGQTIRLLEGTAEISPEVTK